MRRVAVVGAGVTGLVAAHALHRAGLDVTLYEKEARLGGHADTRSVHNVDVDVGFMICNEATYPNLMRLFDELNVDLQPADMSFSVSRENGVEWSSRGLSGLFAQRSNALSPDFWRMLTDAKRFERDVDAFLAKPDPTATMGSFLQERKYSDSFAHNYLLPMCASIWSVNALTAFDFPAEFILRFMKNHSLLSIGVQRPQWLTLSTRSKTYVERITRPFADKCRVSSSVDRVELLSPASDSEPRVRLTDCNGRVDDYHDVLFATHAPDTLRMLGAENAPPELAAFSHQNNKLYLHSDTTLMPRDKVCWSSWNFLGTSADGGVYCSYYLNLLQTLKTSEHFIVTLNPPRPPAAHLTHATWEAAHPVPTVASVKALTGLDAAQGRRGVWFAGAWVGWGFHEDGAKSGLDIANRIAAREWRAPAYLAPFRSSWTQWAAKKLVIGQLSSVIQDGEIEIWERAGQVVRLGQPSANAPGRVRLVIKSPEFYTQTFRRGALGFADAWIDGHVSSNDLTGFFELCIRNKDRRGSPDAKRWYNVPALLSSWHAWYTHKARANTVTNSKKNISAHYDLSNALFATFLDPTMTYSSAIFASDADTLEAAQVRKLETIARKAQIQRGHHVLEIGSGWGSLAIHIARTRGCRVTSLTLSTEQMQWAEERAKEAGAADRVAFKLVDYRKFAEQHTGAKFDRIVSCEMLEAVGHEFFGAYFATLEKLLAPGGIVVLQTIAIPDQRFAAYVKGTDFIQERIFPGGCLPCISALTAAARDHSRLCVEQMDNYPLHYARTLAMWREAFYANRERLERLGFDGTFQRTWDYYFCYCEAGFRTQTLQLLHLVLARPGEATIGVPIAATDEAAAIRMRRTTSEERGA